MYVAYFYHSSCTITHLNQTINIMVDSSTYICFSIFNSLSLHRWLSRFGDLACEGITRTIQSFGKLNLTISCLSLLCAYFIYNDCSPQKHASKFLVLLNKVNNPKLGNLRVFLNLSEKRNVAAMGKNEGLI